MIKLMPPEATTSGADPDRSNLPVVLVDGDDTLWETEPLYDAARDAAAAVVAAEGLDSTQWTALQRRIDVKNVAELGLSPDRFPRSCIEAYRELAHRSGVEPRADVENAVARIARSVFTSRAPLLPGARELLEALRANHRVVLLTQGDVGVQERRIEESGLKSLFDAVFVVPKKSAMTIAQILADLGADPMSGWSVGNSVPSDVNPALTAGMRAIWVDAHVWEHERREHAMASDRLFAVSNLADASALLNGS